MAVREKSPFIPNEIYFITFTILDWKKIFISDERCQLVYEWFDFMKNNYGNRIYGYVIMPNHVHVLLYILDKSPILSKLIFNGKRFLAYAIVKLLKQEGDYGLLYHFEKNVYGNSKARHKVFEERYDSLIIQSERFFKEKLHYIHNNPCVEKWGLAERPEDYTYSSASNYILGSGRYAVDIMDM